jgi:hypothetical protein
MANDKKAQRLACQKCRTPIDIDASIDQLNPAAFKLLTGTYDIYMHQLSCDILTPQTRLDRIWSTTNSQNRAEPPTPPNLPSRAERDICQSDPRCTASHLQAQCAGFEVPESGHVLH